MVHCNPFARFVIVFEEGHFDNPKEVISASFDAQSVCRLYAKLTELCEHAVVIAVGENEQNIALFAIGRGVDRIEIGFAHVLDKKIYLLNLPASGSYNDEIKEINPVIINGDYSLIK
jgi:hypothetical protein